jgi:hypothetical protein
LAGSLFGRVDPPSILFYSPLFGPAVGEAPLIAFGDAILLSELLFLASPIVLLALRPSHLISRIIYTILSLNCVIILALLTPTIVSHLDPTTNAPIQLLPGMLVWRAAQVMLTLAAGLQVVRAYIIKSWERD